ncbi:hypothetical protein CMV_006506 [Castanea mollissima]|uniref:Uncharacterized protein n=1 Tax=Castanea mollissima TaxID=60419 RepID=A0A8J4RQV4_9ROSI|nr:hypothetical protein CMV_006506 [Castanea mollissima]
MEKLLMSSIPFIDASNCCTLQVSQLSSIGYFATFCTFDSIIFKTRGEVDRRNVLLEHFYVENWWLGIEIYKKAQNREASILKAIGNRAESLFGIVAEQDKFSKNKLKGQTGDCGGLLGIRCSAVPDSVESSDGCNNPCAVFKTNEYYCNSGICGPTNIPKLSRISA